MMVAGGHQEDDGEDPAVCALRELGEETPYTAERVEKILDFFSAPGFLRRSAAPLPRAQHHTYQQLATR